MFCYEFCEGSGSKYVRVLLTGGLPSRDLVVVKRNAAGVSLSLGVVITFWVVELGGERWRFQTRVP